MTLASTYSEVANLLVTKLTNASNQLGLQGVYYGDQALLPATPIVCVEPDMKEVVEFSPFRKVDSMITIFIIVYTSAVESPQANRQDSDALAEKIEAFIHKDAQLLRPDLSASVIDCYITRVASGYVKKGTSIIRASRLTFTARTQYQAS